MDEKTDGTKQSKKIQLVGQFYYTLSRVHRKAINYVAYGETEDDKLLRVQDVFVDLETLINGIFKDVPEFVPTPIPEEDCKPPDCYWNEELGMCMCRPDAPINP